MTFQIFRDCSLMSQSELFPDPPEPELEFVTVAKVGDIPKVAARHSPSPGA